MVSTPTVKGESRIDDEYIEGTQEEWQHECPSCKEFHLISYQNMKVDHISNKDNKGFAHVIVKSVIWHCPDCGYGFNESEMRKTKQKYIAQNASALIKGVRSFFMNCFASPWISWSLAMQEGREAKGDPEREKVVVNTRFGES